MLLASFFNRHHRSETCIIKAKHNMSPPLLLIQFSLVKKISETNRKEKFFGH